MLRRVASCAEDFQAEVIQVPCWEYECYYFLERTEYEDTFSTALLDFGALTAAVLVHWCHLYGISGPLFPHIPSHCLGPQHAEGTGLGLCGLWWKKDFSSIIAELLASHKSNLLLPNCNNLALPPCSPGSPCLPHTCAHSCLSCPKAPVRHFSTLPLAWWEAACATPGSQIWGAEGHKGQQQLSPVVCILTVSVVPRTHIHLKSCKVTEGRQIDRQTHTIFFYFTVSTHLDCTSWQCCWSGISSTDLPNMSIHVSRAEFFTVALSQVNKE